MKSLIFFSQGKYAAIQKFSIRTNVGVPKAVSSKQFRYSFKGVLAADANINYKLFSNFFVGVGYSYHYYSSQDSFANPYASRINTNLQMHFGYLKLGYDHYVNEKTFVNFSLNGGYNYSLYEGVQYKNDSLKGKYPTKFSGGFVEPMVGIYYLVDPNFAIGGHITYNYNFTLFNSLYPQLNQWGSSGYTKLPNKWNMSIITFGFGLYYGITNKK